MRQLVASASLLLLGVMAAPAWGQAIQTDQKTVFINEHQVFDPGYAVGNLVIGSPDIADYKVMPGRRQLLLFGKAAGKTSFTIWDQNNVKRHEIAISVMTREDAQAETDLKDLLKDYPSVGVRRLRGELVITGSVDTEQDLEMVGKIAAAGGAQNLVRVSPAWQRQAPGAAPTPGPSAAPATSTAPTAPTAPAAPGAPDPSRAAPRTSAQPMVVAYEVELMDASSQFRSGSYETGTEPSGPRLFKGEVTAGPGEEGVIMIPASAVFARDPKSAPKGEAGIRLKLRPSAPDRAGALPTHVTVETNLPVESGPSDPKIWRRSRWEVTVNQGLPFAIAGADLLAVPDPTNRGGSQTAGQLGRAADSTAAVSGLPGVSNVPQIGQASGVVGTVRELFGLWGTRSEPPPNHLLVLVRPRVVPAAGSGRK